MNRKREYRKFIDDVPTVFDALSGTPDEHSSVVLYYSAQEPHPEQPILFQINQYYYYADIRTEEGYTQVLLSHKSRIRTTFGLLPSHIRKSLWAGFDKALEGIWTS